MMKNISSYLRKLSIEDRIVLAFFITCFIFGLYASLIEPFKLKTTEWTVSTDKWTNSRELKIVILTDLHMIWPWMTPNGC